MFEMMRRVFGPVAVGLIVGAIALVFVVSGVFAPKGAGRMGGQTVAAKVNGDTIAMQEFMREYQQRVEFYQGLMKGNKIDENMLKSLGLRKQVLEDLIRRKLMTQEAERMGLRVSDEEVRDKIREMPYFKNKDGKFDAAQYNQILSSNRYSASSFEEMVRQDLLRQQLADFMRERVRVSTQEVEQEFETSENRREIEYALLTRDTARKLLTVSDKDVQELLKTEAGRNAAKVYYEQNKMDYMKPQKAPAKVSKGAKPAPMPLPEYLPFAKVEKDVAAEVLKNRRTEEIGKLNRALGQELLAKAKAGQLKAFAKSKGIEVKTSEKFHRLQGFISGLGEVPELMNDAFKDDSPLAKEPKLYESAGRLIVVQGLKVFKPNRATFEKDRSKVESQVAVRKSQHLYEQWIGDLRKQAKVSTNKELEQESL